MLEATTEDLEQFKDIKSKKELAFFFGFTLEKWNYLLYKLDSHDKYTKFEIPKKNGEPRIIHAPNYHILYIQKKLLICLKHFYKPRLSTHGFINKKNIVSNATPHENARFVFNLDLKDFFPTIHFGRIRGLLNNWPFNFPLEVASDIANLCCVDGRLPQGSPTSPILSNMICRKLDGKLEYFAKKHHCFYTRYADDITFSSRKKKFPPEIAIPNPENPNIYETSKEIRLIIESHKFEINTSKVRLQHRSQRQEVTGLTVNKKVNVPRLHVRQVKSMLHAWRKFGYDKASSEFITKYDKKFRKQPLNNLSFKEVIRGKINFIKLVRGENDIIYQNLLSQFQILDPINKTSAPKTDTSRVLDSLWVLENDEVTGTAFSLKNIGVITCAHVLSNDITKTFAFRADNITKKYRIKAISIDKDIDLAIIEILDAPSFTKLASANQTSIELEDEIKLAGFPNYRIGDGARFAKGAVVSFRIQSTIERFNIDADIVRGNSGGPVLNKDYDVIGVAVTGADSFAEANKTEDHGVIPITAHKHLKG